MIDIVSLRHALHAIPEIAFEEHKTKALLLKTLKGILTKEQWRIHEFSSNTGILVEYTVTDGDYRLFRADMDALPSTENTNCDFRSTIPGMMHACGHDVHMSVLMGLIQVVAMQEPDKNLLFLFQPAEEGKGGAQSVLAEGIIQRFNIDSAIALHVASELPVGTVSSKTGIFFGIPQEFDVRFKGKAAHVAYPEKGINALLAGFGFINRITPEIAKLAKQERVLFNIGKMESGIIRNVIPDLCTLEGTHRSLSTYARDAMNSLIKDTAATIAEETGTIAEAELLCSYDPVINNESLISEIKDVCGKLDISYIQAETAMTGEDFGFFTTLYPGMLFWLGSGCEHPLHSERFLPEDSCIDAGVRVMSALAGL